MATAQLTRRDLAIVVPAIGSQLVVSTSLFVLPFVVGALVASGNFDEQSAGFLLSLEAISASLTTLAVSAWTRPRSRRLTTLIGVALAVLGNACSLISPVPMLLTAARLVVGIGAGIVAAEVSAVVARGRDRERLISLLTAAAIINGSIWLYVIPVLPDSWGYRVPYLVLLTTCLAGAAFLARLPAPPMRRRGERAQTAAGATGTLGLAVLPAIFLTQLGQGSFWTLAAIYGAKAGLSDATVGAFLSLSTLLLLVGVAGTAWAGLRLGRFGPLFALTIVNVISIVAICYVPDANVYVAANVVQAVTNLSSLVYQLGLAAAVDRTGRVFAAANGLVALGNGVGPAVAGAITVAYGAPHVGLAVVALNALALMLFAAVGAGVAKRAVLLRV